MNLIVALRDYAGQYSNFLSRFTKYFIIGGIAAITEWLTFAGTVFLLGWHYIPAAFLSFLLATAVNYLLGLFFVFKNRRYARHNEILLVYLVSAAGLVINIASLSFLVEWVRLHVVVSKITATGVAFFWNFASRHFWLYRD